MTIGSKSRSISSLHAKKNLSVNQNQKDCMENQKILSGETKQNGYVPQPAKNFHENKQSALSGEKAVRNSYSSQEKNILEIHISSSLQRKLKEKANEEGVALGDFISELLAEGIALRAWEIIERKSTMRSPPNHRQGGRRQAVVRSRNQSGNNGSSNSFSTGYKNKSSQNNYNNCNSRYSNIMEDNANFIEYVRNQEKKSKWS